MFFCLPPALLPGARPGGCQYQRGVRRWGNSRHQQHRAASTDLAGRHFLANIDSLTDTGDSLGRQGWVITAPVVPRYSGLQAFLVIVWILTDKNQAGSPGILRCSAPVGMECEVGRSSWVTKTDHNALKPSVESQLPPGHHLVSLQSEKQSSGVWGEWWLRPSQLVRLPPGQRLGETFLANQNLGRIVRGQTQSGLDTEIIL